jgi:hypothetical protein
MVEVRSKTPIKYSMEFVAVEGQFAVMENDPSGLYCRIIGAVRMTVQKRAFLAFERGLVGEIQSLKVEVVMQRGQANAVTTVLVRRHTQ